MIAGECCGKVRCWGIVEVRGQAGITVVEANDLQAVFNENLAELFRPVDRLGGESHDEDDCRRLWVTRALIGDIDAIWADICGKLVAIQVG